MCGRCFWFPTRMFVWCSANYTALVLWGLLLLLYYALLTLSYPVSVCCLFRLCTTSSWPMHRICGCRSPSRSSNHRPPSLPPPAPLFSCSRQVTITSWPRHRISGCHSPSRRSIHHRRCLTCLARPRQQRQRLQQHNNNSSYNNNIPWSPRWQRLMRQQHRPRRVDNPLCCYSDHDCSHLHAHHAAITQRYT